jgi:prepilin-type N-terminal cleavage/methylation domain-containing protein
MKRCRLEFDIRESERHRRGFSLVELMVTIAIFSFVLACSSVALATMWRAQTNVQIDLARMATLTRFARQLRADAHVANSAQIISSADGRSVGVTLSQVDSQIEYTNAMDRVIRVVHVNGAVVHREVFVLPDTTAASWTLNTTPASMLHVEFDRPEEVATGSTSPTFETIDAVIGIIAGDDP